MRNVCFTIVLGLFILGVGLINALGIDLTVFKVIVSVIGFTILGAILESFASSLNKTRYIAFFGNISIVLLGAIGCACLGIAEGLSIIIAGKTAGGIYLLLFCFFILYIKFLRARQEERS